MAVGALARVEKHVSTRWTRKPVQPHALFAVARGHDACMYELVKASVNVGHITKLGGTTLMLFAARKQLKQDTYTTSKGANAHYRDTLDWTALRPAAFHGSREIDVLLMEYAEVFVDTAAHNGMTPATHACTNGCANVLRYLPPAQGCVHTSRPIIACHLPSFAPPKIPLSIWLEINTKRKDEELNTWYWTGCFLGMQRVSTTASRQPC